MSRHLLSVLLQVASTVTLARLLEPADFGIVTMVLSVTIFATLFQDFGLSTATIQSVSLTQAQQSNIFWLNAIIGTTLTLLVGSVAPAIAWVYDRPELTLVTWCIAPTFLITSLAAQSKASLSRQMNFVPQAVAGLTGSLCSLVVSISMAVAGAGYWSLVAGTFAASFASAIVLYAAAEFRPSRWTPRCGTLQMVRFGANLTAFNFVNYFQRNLDNVMIGYFWGAADLGIYSRAYALMMVPTQSVRAPIDSVALPALSRLQFDPHHYRLFFRKIVAVVASLSMPIGVLLAAFPAQVVQLALGDQWQSSAPVLRWLGLVAFIQPTFMTWGVVALSLKLGRVYLLYGCLFSAACVIGFTTGLVWGPSGVAAGYAAANYLCFFPILFGVYRHTPVRVRDVLQEMTAPMVSSLVALAIGTGFVSALPAGSLSTELVVMALLLVFGTAYVILLTTLAWLIKSELPRLKFSYRSTN